MTFKAGNLTQWSVSPTPPKQGLPQWWGYFTTDAMATVSANDYFNLGIGQVIGRNTTFYVGDLLYCVCSDGVASLQIATLTPNITTTASSADIPAGSITHVMLGAGIVDLNNLAPGITPSGIVVDSAQYTTVGGAAAEAIVIAGALNTDLAFVQLVNQGPNTVTIKIAVMTAGHLTVTFSADPGAGAIINYQILRAPA
jgi:hypothetical protein